MLLPEQSRSRYSVIASDVMAVCDIVLLCSGPEMMDCHVQGTMKITPFYQVAFIQTHTVTRFHNLAFTVQQYSVD